jgi:hypothetical protein
MKFELFGVILDIRNQKWDIEGRIFSTSEILYIATLFSGSAHTFISRPTYFINTVTPTFWRMK